MLSLATYKADYKLNDGKGNIVTDYLGILGSATMSNPSPSWIPVNKTTPSLQIL